MTEHAARLAADADGRPRRQALVVVGMHRSGTSALTRVLSLLGATLPKNLMQSQFDNETGFWEPLRIVNFHDEILRSIDSHWDDVLPVDGNWFASGAARASRERLIELTREEFGDSRLFVLKDPRVCRLLPLWAGVFEELDIGPVFVHMIRNPLEVAQSLAARNSFPRAKSLLLWLAHILISEQATRGWRRAFVSYEDLLRDPVGTVERFSHSLKLAWPRDSYLAKAEIAQFLSSRHRHHTVSDEEVLQNRGVAGWIREAYRLLAMRESEECIANGFDTLRSRYLEASEQYGELIAVLEHELELERGRLRGVESERERLAQANAGLEAQRAELAEANARLEAQRAELAEVNAGLEAQRVELAEVNAGLEAQRVELAEVNAGLEAQRAELAEANAALEGQKAGLAAANAALEEQRTSLISELTDREDRILRLQSRAQRASWLLTWLWALRDLPRVLRSGIFDAHYYRTTYPDIGASRVPALMHFLRHGARENRDPNSLFSTSWYKQSYPDVADMGVNPLVHYLRWGANEGRDPHPEFSTLAYCRVHPEVRTSGENPLAHCLRHDQSRKGVRRRALRVRP